MTPSAEPRPLRLSRVFAARRERVFAAWSSAEHVTHWFGPETYTVPDAKVDVRPGGAFEECMRSPGGLEHWTRGTFIEVTPCTRVVIDMRVTGEAGETLLRAMTEVNFVDVPGGTHMDVMQTCRLIDLAVAAPMVAGAAEGWRATLDKLVRHGGSEDL